MLTERLWGSSKDARKSLVGDHSNTQSLLFSSHRRASNLVVVGSSPTRFTMETLVFALGVFANGTCTNPVATTGREPWGFALSAGLPQWPARSVGRGTPTPTRLPGILR